jgi:hypothetical protein
MKRILWAILAGAVMTTACADPTAPVTPTPVTPTIRETFSDTLLLLGTNMHQFNVSAIGGVQITLSSVDPAAPVGIGVGTPSLGSCSVIQRVDPATAGPSVLLSGTTTVPGAYCVVIYDPADPTTGLGRLTVPVAYVINVLHS